MAPPGHSVTSSDTQRIHILSVIDDLHFGGDEYRLLAFATSLDRARFRHTVATVVKEDRLLGERYGSMREQYERAGIEVLDLGFPATALGAGARRSLARRVLSVKEKVQKLAALIRREQVDVLDVHLSPATPIGALAAISTRTPFAVTLYQVNQMRSRKLWLSGQFNLGAASQLITDSQTQAEVVRKWLLATPSICVIANGTPAPKATIAREDMLRFFDIPGGEPATIIGQISSLVPYKGQLVVLEAARRVLDQEPNCIFLLVGYERGEQGYTDLLRRRAVELQISDRVRISGYPGAIGDVWSIIDVHVHGSLLDSLPNALLEAMSLGKPSVITAVGGIPEVIQHGVNGLLVSPGNSQELAQCLLTVLRDSRLRERLGSAAHARYSQDFGPDRMTRSLESVFSRLAIDHRNGNVRKASPLADKMRANN